MSFQKALEEICDNYCKKPDEIKDQDELDKVCDNCPIVKFLMRELSTEEVLDNDR